MYKINCSDCHASYIGETGRNLTTRLTEHKKALRKGDVNNHIAKHHRLTNHTIDWDSAQCLAYSTDHFPRLTLESWCTDVNHYRYYTNDSFTTSTLQTNEQNDLTSLTDRDRPITTDLRHLSLTADNITAKLTNQLIQTGPRTFDWQQLFTRLWWWLSLRLSKRQSPLPTTVYLRTTLARTIELHYYRTIPVPLTIFWWQKRRMISETHNSSCYLKHLLLHFFKFQNLFLSSKLKYSYES